MQPRNKLIEKALLKSILPIVSGQAEWAKSFSELGRASYIQVAGKTGREKKGKCMVCGRTYENYLLFILHLEMIHSKEIAVNLYEFTDDVLTIHFKPAKQGKQFKTYLSSNEENDYALIGSFQKRTKEIFDKIFLKFIRKRRQRKQKQEYYHSIDIFREVRPESEDQDSEAEIGEIERELERMRISDFSDVNENDKFFFVKWNDIIYEAKKKHVILNHKTFIQVLEKFAGIAKAEGIKRINIVIHAWTLWSSGKISAEEVTSFLLSYDNAIIPEK